MKILFITHSFEASGAPLLLLTIIQHLKAQGITCYVYSLKKSGPLKDTFAQYSTLILPTSRLKSRIQYEWLNALIQFKRIDLVYFNTIASLSIEPWIKAHRKLVHVHELASVIERFNYSIFNRLKNATDLPFLTLSKSTKDYLNQLNPTATVHYSAFFQDFSNFKAGNQNPFAAITGNSFPVVLGCGTVEPRKGTDLFIQTAQYYSRYINGNVNFVWLGKDVIRNYSYFIEKDVNNSGLKNLFLLNKTADVAPFFEHASLLFLPSREESFGRVMLEAAFFEKPVIAFKSAGGPQEILYDTNGLMSGFGDVRAVSEKIDEFIRSEPMRAQLGSLLKTRALRDFNVERNLSPFLTIIKELAGKRQ